MRFKNRYLLCEFAWSDPSLTLPALNSHSIYKELRNLIQSNFGEFGFGRVLQSLQVKYWNSRTNIAIVRCSRDDHFMLRAAFTYCTNIQKVPVIVRVLHTGGTIRQCQEATIRHLRHSLLSLTERELALKAGHSSNDSNVRARLESAAVDSLKQQLNQCETEVNQLDT